MAMRHFVERAVAQTHHAARRLGGLEALLFEQLRDPAQLTASTGSRAGGSTSSWSWPRTGWSRSWDGPLGRNLVADPTSSLVVVDRDDTTRFVQIRGDAELVTDGALEHLDALTRSYTCHPAYYGHM